MGFRTVKHGANHWEVIHGLNGPEHWLYSFSIAIETRSRQVRKENYNFGMRNYFWISTFLVRFVSPAFMVMKYTPFARYFPLICSAC